MGIFSALRSDNPKFKKLKEDGCVVTLSIEIPPQEAQGQSQTELLRLQSRARIPGFRAGRAPLEIIKQHFANRARAEAAEALIHKYLPTALTDLKLHLIDSPRVENMLWKEGDPLLITLRAEVAPTPIVKNYHKISVTRKPQVADAAVMDKRLEELRDAQARLEISPMETVEENHFVVIAYSSTRNGKSLPNAKISHELVDMSLKQRVAGLTEGLKGMKRGESKIITVKLGDLDTALDITVTEIKTKIIPELDAEFAKDMGADGIEELKSKLKEILDREVKSDSEFDVVRQIEEALVKTNAFPLPPSLVARQLDGMMEKMTLRLAATPLLEKTLPELRAQLLPKAEDELRLMFVLVAIADKEKISVSDAEIASALEEDLNHAENDAGKKKIVDFFTHRRNDVAHLLRARKTIKLLKETAVYKDS